MGCCLGILLLAGAPRVALLLWWLVDPLRFQAVFGGWSTVLGSITFPVWIWPLLGFLLLPWTTVAYVFVAPGGIGMLEWLILVLALLLDLSTHGGGGRYYSRRRSAIVD